MELLVTRNEKLLRQSIWPDSRTYYNETFYGKGRGMKLNAPLVRKGESASLSIASDYEGAEQWKTIAEAFGIEDEHHDALKKAVSQAFQEDDSHGKDLLTIENSLLCFLLHFYRGEFALKLGDAAATGSEKTYVGKEVRFEDKHPVFVGPSNVDGYILMEAEDGEKINLFLEGKFCEFFEAREKGEGEFREPYYDLFKKYDCFRNNPTIAVRKSADKNGMPNTLLIKKDEGEKEASYLEGLKQMVAHFTGLVNDREKIDGPIVLGLIDYPFAGDESDEGNRRRKIFEKDYALLAQRLNEYSQENDLGIRVLPEPLHYGLDIKCPDPIARAFYNED